MIETKAILQALKAVRSLVKNYEASGKKKSLLQDDHDLYLQVTMKKIPKLKSMKRIKVALPHRLFKDTDEVCLIAGDLDKKNVKADIEQDISHYKELLEKHGIKEINEVVTLRQLRTEYKQFEAKQKLLAAYDVFLTDNKITECLPKVLGRHFFKKRKFPVQINIHTKNLKQQIERALATKVFQITGNGNSCACEVAYLSMEDSNIVDNIVAMAKTLSDQLPGCWNNVMGIYLKTSLSKAIPLYVSYDDPNEVQLDEVEDDDNGEIDELTTFLNMNVKVYKDGKVEVLKIKDRLQEEGETEGENEVSCDSMPTEDTKQSRTLKKRKPKNCSLTENFIEKNEFPDGSPAELPVEDMKKSKKSNKRKSQDFSLMNDVISEKNELPHDSEPAKKMKKGLKSKRGKAQECSLEKNEFPHDIMSVEKTNKGLKSKRKKAQECSVENVIPEKNESPHDVMSVGKTNKGLKSKRKKAQECSMENVIPEKRRKNKEKHL